VRSSTVRTVNSGPAHAIDVAPVVGGALHRVVWARIHVLFVDGCGVVRLAWVVLAVAVCVGAAPGDIFC
jgi:hypothetical protein